MQETTSNRKLAKKARQIYKRELIRRASIVVPQLKVVNNALRPRPKWFPRKIWSFLCSFFVDIKMIEKAINPQNPDLSTENDINTIDTIKKPS
jgi:hypothetical protein